MTELRVTLRTDARIHSATLEAAESSSILQHGRSEAEALGKLLIALCIDELGPVKITLTREEPVVRALRPDVFDSLPSPLAETMRALNWARKNSLDPKATLNDFILDSSLEVLYRSMPVRFRKALSKAGLKCLRDAVGLDRQVFLDVRGCGYTTVSQIHQLLLHVGTTGLKMPIPLTPADEA